jgi:hypothetical protein
MRMFTHSFRIFSASFAVALLTTTALGWAAHGRSETGPRRVGQTTILSEPALRRLKANKGVGVQWLWGSKPGPLQVTETPEGVRLVGHQGPTKHGSLKIDGFVERIDSSDFTFRGRIVIVDAGEPTAPPCVREGRVTFRIRLQRPYWRMKEQAAHCAGRSDVADYVDIQF